MEHGSISPPQEAGPQGEASTPGALISLPLTLWVDPLLLPLSRVLTALPLSHHIHSAPTPNSAVCPKG